MVGKVSGARAKNRRRPDSASTSAEPSTGTGTTPFALSESSSAVPDTPANAEPVSILSPSSNSLGAWDLNFDFADNSESTTQTDIDMTMSGTTVLDRISVATTKPMGEMDMWYGHLESLPSLSTGSDQNPDDFLATLPASPNKRYKLSDGMFSGQSTKPGDMPDVGHSELEYIARCSEIIEAVEKTLNYKSCTLDQVLGACKRHVISLATVINHEEFECSIGCRTVTLTALNLIITLLERCIKADEIGADESPSLASDDGGRLFQFRYSLPRVSFGSLHYDNGEQFAFCSHLMQAELSRTIAVLNTLKRRTPSGTCRGSTSAVHIQEIWCGDFQKRLLELSNMLSKVKGSSGS